MHFIKKFKSLLLYYNIRSEKKRTVTKSKAKNIEECKNILLLFDYDDKLNTKTVQELFLEFKNNGQKPFMLGFSDSVKNETDDGRVIPSTDLNWYGKPKATSTSGKLIAKDWDAVLGLYDRPIACLDYIVMKTKATTKAGLYHLKSESYDIMVDKKSADMSKAVKQLIKILKTIKSRSYEPAI